MHFHCCGQIKERQAQQTEAWVGMVWLGANVGKEAKRVRLLYTLVARRDAQRITLTSVESLIVPVGAYTPLRFHRTDGMEVAVDIYWQMTPLPTPAERDEVIARIHCIAERPEREEHWGDQDG
jgi:hypothetical protein